MNEMKKFYLVDAFTDRIFSGNPACVFLSKEPLDEKTMQMIAREFNLSETAFPAPTDSDDFETSTCFHLRWFTPVVEVPLCGHATLATAHILYSELHNSCPSLSFSTQSGDLIVSKKENSYVMDFPAGELIPVDIDSEVISALHLEIESVRAMMYCPNPNKLLVEIDREKLVRDLSPDFLELTHISQKFNAGSIVVTSASTSIDYDFISRNFAPIHGVNEDPVTGSAHVLLGPYWQSKLGKHRLRAFQVSSRGGFMEVEVKDNGRVDLIGTACTVAEGHFRV